MKMTLEKFGNWKRVEQGTKNLPALFEKIRPIITRKIGERYIEMVKEEIVKKGPLIPPPADPTQPVQDEMTGITDAELLSFITVTMKDDGSVFAGLDHEIYIGKLDVLDFFFKKEFGMLGPKGAGVWRRCYHKMHSEIPDIVRKEVRAIIRQSHL
jgi:hypothetical protein